MDTTVIYDKIINWLITAGPRILLAVVVFIVGQWFIRLLKKWTNNAMVKKRFAPSLRPFIHSFLFTLMQVLLIVAIMQILGIQMSIFAALIGAVGVAAGLALSGTLQNFTSGILILALKPYRVGDNIIAQGHEGTVSSIQLFYTVVTTYDNKSLIIPNSKLSNELIVNISQSGSRRLDTEMRFPFAVPFEQAKQMIEKAIHDYGKITEKPPHRIGVTQIDVDGYRVVINTWMPAHGFEDGRLAFREVLLQNLVGSGMKLPQEIHL